MNALVGTDEFVGQRESLRADAEAGLLGCLVLAPERIDEVSSIVSAPDFVLPEHQRLYAMIVAMREARKPVTAATVAVECKKSGLLEQLGGTAEYFRLVQSLPNGANYRVYANEVARLSACRQAEHAGLAFLRSLSRPDCNPRDAIDALVGRVQDIGVPIEEHAERIADVMREVHAEGSLPDDAFDKSRMKTGYSSLDDLIGGLYAKNLALLGGYNGSGKSAMAADMGAHAAADGKSVLLFSVEMTAKEFAQRVLSIEAGISMSAWQRPRTQAEQERILSVAEYANSWRWWIDDTSRQTLQSIRGAARLRKVSDGLDLLIIDNLALIQGNSRDKKVERYKAVTEELKRLSRELDCCILLIAQLNAEAATNEPNETSWADCKSIQADADVAMMLHRLGDSNDYNLIVTKNRSRGPRGKISLCWDGEHQRFSDVVNDPHTTGFGGAPWSGDFERSTR